MSRVNAPLAAALLLASGIVATGTVNAGNRIYVTNEHEGSLSIIDATTYELVDTVKVGQQPRGIGMSPDGKEIYIALGRDDAIAVVDPASGKVLRNLDGGEDPENFICADDVSGHCAQKDSSGEHGWTSRRLRSPLFETRFNEL